MPAQLDSGSSSGAPPQPKDGLRAFVLALTLRRVGATLLMAVLAALIISPIFVTPTLVVVGRFMVIALVLVLLFTAVGVWRQRWVPTWVLQLVVVLAAAPLMTFVVYLPSMGGDIKEVFNHEGRAQGFVSITASTMFWGALLVMGALFREREARSRSAELSFALERSQLERQAADAQLKLMQAQIEPHFLFNTLANVQALVESGSPRAAPVLASLIAYLRAMLPRLSEERPTLAGEAALVRAYLELMQMRIPDRLQFSVDVQPERRRPGLAAAGPAHVGGERGSPWHRPVRARRAHRRQGLAQRRRWRGSPDSGRHRRRTGRDGAARDGPRQPACAPGGVLWRPCAARTAGKPASGGARGGDHRGRHGDARMTGSTPATALIADDEPLLRERLRSHLARLWPELQIVAEARNGREAVELFDQHLPGVVFLDVHMPGLNGVDAARSIARRAEVVFITAYEQYAVQAFQQGALDYLVKPFDEARLSDTVQRLKGRLQAANVATPAAAQASLDGLLAELSAELRRRYLADGRATPYLQWIKASVGTTVRLIPVEQVAYLRSDEKYTLVVWDGGEALIRRTIRELADELDPDRFAQIHRSVIVNLHQVAQVTRGPNETADVQLKGRHELLPVSRSFVHVFRQM